MSQHRDRGLSIKQQFVQDAAKALKASLTPIFEKFSIVSAGPATPSPSPAAFFHHATPSDAASSSSTTSSRSAATTPSDKYKDEFSPAL